MPARALGARTTRRLRLFAAITVLGVAFVAVRYAGAAPLVGLGPTEVRLELTDAAGLTTKNEVSYRGREIGEVGSVHAVPGGVEVDVLLDRTAPPVPASAVAVVAPRSAIGEVFIDLRPTDERPPFLTEGSVIPRERTRLPLPVDAWLTSLDALAASVPVPELRATVEELHAAVDRTGPDLRRLLDGSDVLVDEALRHLPRTTQLLRDGDVVLGTQARLGPQITALGRDLRLVAEQLRRDDPNLRRLVAAAPSTAVEVDGLVRDAGPDLSRTLADLLTVAGILEPRRAGLEQFLVTGPFAAAIGNTVLPGDGRLHFGLVLNIDDPPPCREGYLRPDGGWRSAAALEPLPMDTSVRCREAPPVSVRGAQNAPGAATSTDPLGQRPVTAFDALGAGPTGAGTGAPPVVLPGLTP